MITTRPCAVAGVAPFRTAHKRCRCQIAALASKVLECIVCFSHPVSVLLPGLPRPLRSLCCCLSALFEHRHGPTTPTTAAAPMALCATTLTACQCCPQSTHKVCDSAAPPAAPPAAALAVALADASRVGTFAPCRVQGPAQVYALLRCLEASLCGPGLGECGCHAGVTVQERHLCGTGPHSSTLRCFMSLCS